ncbi:MAG: helix-turn-helix domain-containing protein [Acidobacteriota bacterium]|nr:helix-turn-helix domain-containing protein [Acidobacteriota bacterium]
MKSGSEANERERIARILRELRLAKKLRQIDVAKALGEPQSYISRVESGDARLDLVELRRICKVLGIPLREFVRKFEEPRA